MTDTPIAERRVTWGDLIHAMKELEKGQSRTSSDAAAVALSYVRRAIEHASEFGPSALPFVNDGPKGLGGVISPDDLPLPNMNAVLRKSVEVISSPEKATPAAPDDLVQVLRDIASGLEAEGQGQRGNRVGKIREASAEIARLNVQVARLVEINGILADADKKRDAAYAEIARLRDNVSISNRLCEGATQRVKELTSEVARLTAPVTDGEVRERAAEYRQHARHFELLSVGHKTTRPDKEWLASEFTRAAAFLERQAREIERKTLAYDEVAKDVVRLTERAEKAEAALRDHPR